MDSLTGISVFFYLKDLGRDRIYVTLADGKAAAFAVTACRRSPRPPSTASVYGKAAIPTCGVITCGGAFDNATTYNIIVYAHL